MYEDTFGTDWSAIDDREEAVRRAFALGVAARLGERHAGELDRINGEVDTSYDRSFVELAYHEGRDKASEYDVVDEETEERVWTDLVEGTTEFDPGVRDRTGDEDEEPGGPPDLLDFTVPETTPDDSREAVQRPKFLSRAEAEEPDPEDRRSRRSRSTRSDEDGSEPSEEERERFRELLESSDDDRDD